MNPTPADALWRPSDLEAVRVALRIPVTPAAIRAIGEAMQQLERHYPDAIPAARGHLDAIDAIDSQLAALTAADLSSAVKVSRKGAAGEPPDTAPMKKLDVIEYDTSLFLEESETEFASGAPSPAAVLQQQRRSHAEALLLALPRLEGWIPQRGGSFSGHLCRG
jgi:hypothetical protein